MDSSFYFDMLGYGQLGRRKKTKKSKKKKADNWFETLTVTQLKDLCKAANFKISGTKADLCNRLLADHYTRDFSIATIFFLKRALKDQMLVQSGDKYTQVLRLIHNEKGTGQVKRAATEMTIDNSTGEQVQTLKKRKINPKPETMYTRVEKKIKAVSQKKYKSRYGYKRHAPDVFDLLGDLMKEFCIQSCVMETDPLLAFRIVKSGFEALYDHWQVMENPGYAGFESEMAFQKLETILKVVKEALSSEDIEEMVVLLENVNACMKGYCINMSYGGENNNNIIHQAIRIIMPTYDEKSRTTTPKGKCLESDLRSLAAFNGIPYP